MTILHSLDARRDQQQLAAVREQWLAFAGHGFDLVVAIAAHVKRAGAATPTAPHEPPLKATEAARRLHISPSTLRERTRNGLMDAAVIRSHVEIRGDREPPRTHLRFRADVIDAMASATVASTRT